MKFVDDNIPSQCQRLDMKILCAGCLLRWLPELWLYITPSPQVLTENSEKGQGMERPLGDPGDRNAGMGSLYVNRQTLQCHMDGSSANNCLDGEASGKDQLIISGEG